MLSEEAIEISILQSTRFCILLKKKKHSLRKVQHCIMADGELRGTQTNQAEKE